MWESCCEVLVIAFVTVTAASATALVAASSVALTAGVDHAKGMRAVTLGQLAANAVRAVRDR